MEENKAKYIFDKLISIGQYLRNFHNDQNSPKKYNQYMVACMVSETELENGDISFLEEVQTSLKENQPQIDIFVKYERLLFFVNQYDAKSMKVRKCIRHTEALFLDPDGQILTSMKEGTELTADMLKESHHVAEMKEDFVRSFGEDEKRYLFVLSHYIPCTIKHHNCAELLRRYAQLTDDILVVGYQTIFPQTDEIKALKTMESLKVMKISPEPNTVTGLSQNHTSPARNFQSKIRNKKRYDNRLSPYQTQTSKWSQQPAARRHSLNFNHIRQTVCRIPQARLNNPSQHLPSLLDEELWQRGGWRLPDYCNGPFVMDFRQLDHKPNIGYMQTSVFGNCSMDLPWKRR